MSAELWTALGTATLNQAGNIISTAMANSANERMQHEQNKWNWSNGITEECALGLAEAITRIKPCELDEAIEVASIKWVVN